MEQGRENMNCWSGSWLNLNKMKAKNSKDIKTWVKKAFWVIACYLCYGAGIVLIYVGTHKVGTLHVSFLIGGLLSGLGLLIRFRCFPDKEKWAKHPWVWVIVLWSFMLVCVLAIWIIERSRM